jgi:hypothetical protein
MRRFPIFALVALLTLTTQSNLFSQEAPPLREDFRRERPILFPGDIVRVTAPEFAPEPVEGRVVGFGPDTLFIELRKAAEGRMSIPTESITALDRLDESTTGAGAVLGVLVGLAAGATLAGELANNTSQFVRSLAVVGGAVVGAYGGYWAGIRVEKLLAGDKWEPIPLSRIQVGLGPTRNGGLAIGVSFSF